MDSGSSFVSCECIGGTCVTEVVRVVDRVTIRLCWAVEKIGSAKLEADMRINGGEEMDDCMAEFDECNIGTEGFDAVLVIEGVKL